MLLWLYIPVHYGLVRLVYDPTRGREISITWDRAVLNEVSTIALISQCTVIIIN